MQTQDEIIAKRVVEVNGSRATQYLCYEVREGNNYYVSYAPGSRSRTWVNRQWAEYHFNIDLGEFEKMLVPVTIESNDLVPVQRQ